MSNYQTAYDGYNCAYCGQWVAWGGGHNCQRVIQYMPQPQIIIPSLGTVQESIDQLAREVKLLNDQVKALTNQDDDEIIAKVERLIADRYDRHMNKDHKRGE